MPDLFDGFFTKLGTKLNGGKSVQHYGGASQVNTGKFYNYYSSPTNNNYWLPRDQLQQQQQQDVVIPVDKARSSSITSMNDEESGKTSRIGSVSE
ncbi:uncharacterized protein J8A68_001347 [[Candida] subhashii]|uniref:Uncharacterized protein n=1 Tax=[Candida] subhashii TaxID=561895 RepID=A0A8J5QRE3_9ASCO|nr:uncharacterized protein J8A68_001347 [[Candida] subhashii]KAG7665291.1 hypothetical protein J8A68_001347 [[Candida] subhashii]